MVNTAGSPNMVAGKGGSASAFRLRLTSGLGALLMLSSACLLLRVILQPRTLTSRPSIDSLRHLRLLRPAESSSTPRLPFPLWWAGPFWSSSGYGTEAIAFIGGLMQARLMDPADVWISQCGDKFSQDVSDSMEPTLKALLTSLDHDQQRVKLPPQDLSRPAIVVCHMFPNAYILPGEFGNQGVCPTGDMRNAHQAAYVIGRTMFETDRLPIHLADHVKQMDEVWVPSQFNVETFAASGVPREKLFVVPQSVNMTVFDPARHTPLNLRNFTGLQLVTGTERPANSTPDYVFLSIFKWEIRKGWDILLRAYLEEFEGNESVVLLIVTKARDELVDVDDWGRKIRIHIRSPRVDNQVAFEDLPRIYVYSGYVPDSDYPGLYKACDTLVIPTRGEGWGRPQIEAMAMEMPVISTNWSGSTAFMNDNNSYLLRYDGLASTADTLGSRLDTLSVVKNTPGGNVVMQFMVGGQNSFFYGASWAAPSPQHLRHLMRHVMTHPEEARAKGRAARQHLIKNFSPEVVAGQLYQQILRVQRRLTEELQARPNQSTARDLEFDEYYAQMDSRDAQST